MMVSEETSAEVEPRRAAEADASPANAVSRVYFIILVRDWLMRSASV